MDFKEYYRTLGVDKSASADDIKKAFRKLARRYHPDVSKEPDAAARMAEVNEAHAVLSDPEKRAAYDQLGQHWQQGMNGAAAASGAQRGPFQPPPNWDAGFEFTDHGGFGGDDGERSEFFEQVFGRAARAQRAGRNGAAQGPLRGDDHHAKIELELPDAYQGIERLIALQSARLDAEGRLVPERRELQVKIPKGVREGQMIRLAGQGSPGHHGGAAGDLLLQVAFKPDARWRADGKDVTQRLRVTPWEAALGGPVVADTLAGRLEIAVPAGSSSGRKLRVKGRGIPAAEPGDLYLEIEPAIPGAVTPEQRAAWAALAQAYPGFDPR